MTQAQSVVIPYRPRQWARALHASQKRWHVLVLHRRAGKTVGTINHHIRACVDDQWERDRLLALDPSLNASNLRDLLRQRFYGHILPTRVQAKLVAWPRILKYYCEAIPEARPNESDLRIDFGLTGASLQLFGADRPDSLRGPAFSGISFDEYSQHPPGIFSEVISKALADHLGYAIFLGTIKGKNQLYQTFEAAKANPDEWFSLWQDIDSSLRTETDAATMALKQALADDRKLVEQGLMSQEEFDQEWYLSIDAAIRGAYYQQALATAREQGRITEVPHTPGHPVDTSWDLGIADSTAIWFSQTFSSGQVRVIDYLEDSGEGLAHYATELQKKTAERGFVYGRHIAPHDIKVRELGSGVSRLETARKLGIKFHVAKDIGLADGIEATRAFMSRCWFDAKRCEPGIEALTHYRKRWNDRLKQFSDEPEHDWAEHGASGFRYLAVGSGSIKAPRPAMRPRPVTSGWMG